MDIAAMIGATLKSNPDGLAIDFKGGSYNWSDANRVAEALRRVVAEAGVAPAERIALVARNRPPHVATVWGAFSLRRCASMIYSFQSPEKIAGDIRALRAPVVVADRQDWTAPTLEAARDAGSIALELTGDAVAPVRVLPGLAQVGPAASRQTLPDIGVEMLSSGTTGAPKRVPLHNDIIKVACAESIRTIDSMAPDPAALFVLPLPIANISGMYFILPLAANGRAVCLMERFDVEEWVSLVEKHRTAYTGGPPTMLAMLLDAKIPRERLSSLKFFGCGAAPVDPLLQARFQKTYGIMVAQAYGATEFCGVIAAWTPDAIRTFGESKLGAVGLPQPGVKLRTVSPETGEVLPAGEPGLLEAWVPRMGERWIRTTDLARVDPDGFLYILGRADNAIVRGGFKIIPEAVNQVLREHPAVLDVAVIGVPDARLGQVPVAAIEFAAGAATPSERELEDFVRVRLPSHNVPVRWRFVDALPRNPSLKVTIEGVRRLFDQ